MNGSISRIGFHNEAGHVSVSGTFVPEPGALGLLELGLLGNGVIGLAGMVRRKLKLGT